MGCDIHLYFEERDSNGDWEQIIIDERLIPNDRNYALFGFLAGITGCEFDPLFGGRGLPKETSYLEDIDDDLGDYGYTYAYLDEIINAPWKENSLEHCYFHLFCKEILPRICGYYSWDDMKIEERRSIRVLIGFNG